MFDFYNWLVSGLGYAAIILCIFWAGYLVGKYANANGGKKIK